MLYIQATHRYINEFLNQKFYQIAGLDLFDVNKCFTMVMNTGGTERDIVVHL